MSVSLNPSQSTSQTYVPICNGTAIDTCTVAPTTKHNSEIHITQSPTETVTLIQPDGSSVTITYPCQGTKIKKCEVKPSKGHKESLNSSSTKPALSNFGLLLCLFVIGTLFTSGSVL